MPNVFAQGSLENAYQQMDASCSSSAPLLTSPPKIGPVSVRESYRVEGPERILSDESETS